MLFSASAFTCLFPFYLCCSPGEGHLPGRRGLHLRPAHLREGRRQQGKYTVNTANTASPHSGVWPPRLGPRCAVV